MSTYEQALSEIAETYGAAVAAAGGRSLARVATIVVNRGSFFDALAKGATCNVRNFEALAAYFRDPANWPSGKVPNTARAALNSIGRPALEGDPPPFVKQPRRHRRTAPGMATA